MSAEELAAMDAKIVADTIAEMQRQIEQLTGARHSMYDPAVAIARDIALRTLRFELNRLDLADMTVKPHTIKIVGPAPTPDIAGLCERQLVTITHKLPEVAFLAENARYFETRPTGGEDAAHWSNVFNAKNCRQAADTLERQAAENKRLRVALERIADPRNIHFAGDAQVVARAALTGED